MNMKKDQKIEPLITSREEAEEIGGYGFFEVKLALGSSWWIIGPSGRNMGFVLSVQRGVERCEDHRVRNLSE